MKYDKFIEIVHTASYSSVYHDKNGKEKTIDLSTTNAYLKGEAFAPDNVTVIGGKTGTTDLAGNCLILLTEEDDHPYISIVMNADTKSLLYKDMTAIVEAIPE